MGIAHSMTGAPNRRFLRPDGTIAAHAIFFPMGAAYAAIALPASVAAMLGGPAIPGLAGPAGHAHEMLFGFALAIVAGNQLGPVPIARLALLAGAWLAGRIAFDIAPASIAAAAANAAFAGLLALHLVPRLVARVRKLRNRALPAAIVALGATAVGMEAAIHAGSARVQHTLLLAGVTLIALVMGFMGARIIAPAAAGHFHRRGHVLAAREQPRLEGVFVVAMLVALAALPFEAARVGGAALALAAAVCAVRLARWRPWRLVGSRELLGLAVGYAWLAAGLAGMAGALFTDASPVTALHLVTIGAMGTLTIQVMALTAARLARRDPARLVLPAVATALVALATIGRVAADLVPSHRIPALALAAAAWSLAYALLIVSLARISRAS